jgi:uncharacterized protein involved in type VI secretion and phage assembly
MSGAATFFGKYRGSVTEVDAQTLRIKAQVPSVLKDKPSGWCEPCVPYAGPSVGFVMLPEVGSGVWIEFEGGDPSLPIWVGCYWREGEIPPDADADIKAIYVKTGSLAFDNNGSTVTLQDASQHTAVIDSNGVTLTGGSAGKVAVGSSSVSVNDGALEVS